MARVLGLQGAGRFDAIERKCDPIVIGSLKKQPGFFSDYHMSESSWITIALDDSVLEHWKNDRSREWCGPE